MLKYGFGVDVGGTTCKLGLFKEDGSLLDKWEIKTVTEDGGKAILPDIAKSINEKIEEMHLNREDVIGIGLGVPGPVTDDGVIRKAVNLGWGVFNIEETLSEISGFKVKAGNDASVAALGESWVGGGKDYNSIVLVTLGTGIGGGIVINGKILSGAHGAGAEIGHIVINPDEPVACNCGLHGCIEQYASATGIVRVAKEYIANTDKESKLKTIDDVSAKDVFDAAKAGDALALEIVDDVCGKLATMLGRVCCTVDPEAVLIGGGVSKAGEIITDTIKKTFADKTFHACRETKIELATLGNDAGIFGAAKLIFE